MTMKLYGNNISIMLVLLFSFIFCRNKPCKKKTFYPTSLTELSSIQEGILKESTYVVTNVHHTDSTNFTYSFREMKINIGANRITTNDGTIIGFRRGRYVDLIDTEIGFYLNKVNPSFVRLMANYKNCNSDEVLFSTILFKREEFLKKKVQANDVNF